MLVTGRVEHLSYAFLISIGSGMCEALLLSLASILLLASHRDVPYLRVLVLGGVHAGHRFLLSQLLLLIHGFHGNGCCFVLQ